MLRFFLEGAASEASEGFRFLASASAALVFFYSEADGRIGVGVGAGGAEESGSFSSGTPLVDALTISSGMGGVWTRSCRRSSSADAAGLSSAAGASDSESFTDGVASENT